MRKPLALAALGALALVFAAESASAQSTPWIDQRRAWQQQRIYDGVQDGSLNPYEANRLYRGQARVGRMERRAYADGVVTPWERRRLHRNLNRQSRRIWWNRHD